MQICKGHWDVLRNAINDRGIGTLAPESREEAEKRAVSMFLEGETVDNYDPLMAACCAIYSNGLTFINDIGGDVFSMFKEDSPEYIKCPICFMNYLSIQHDLNCTRKNCEKQRGSRFEWMIDRAADDALSQWRSM